MILSETEEMLVIIFGAFMFMAIIGNTIKDYRRMTREAKKEIAQREKDEAYVKQLKEVIDLEAEKLQKHIKEKSEEKKN
jgi:flagellar motor component MotA